VVSHRPRATLCRIKPKSVLVKSSLGDSLRTGSSLFWAYHDRVRLLSQVRDAGVGLWRTLDAPWLSKLGGLGTLIWIAPILFGALRALTTLDALTVGVIVVGVVGLVVQAVRHRREMAARPQPGYIQAGPARLTRVVDRGPARAAPAQGSPSPSASARPAFISGLNVKGGRIADNVAAGDVDFIRDSELDETDVEGNIHETSDEPPPLPDNNPVPTDLKTEARTLVRAERDRRAASEGRLSLSSTLLDDLKYEYSNLREIAILGASSESYREAATDNRIWRRRVEERLRRANFESAARFVFTAEGFHRPLQDAGEVSPFVQRFLQAVARASDAQRETQELIGSRLDRLQALIEALEEPEGES
jgi:hypothetical protein